MQSLLLERPEAFLRYLDLPGQEVPLVFLHGLGCASSADFPRVTAHPWLAGRRALLVDLLGHGYSDGPNDFNYSLEGHAQTVAQLLDHLSLQGCVTVGHSMGGSVAITLAASRPDLVSRLVIAEGNLDPLVIPQEGDLPPGSRWIARQTEREFEATGHLALVKRFLADGRGARAGTFRICTPLGLHRSAVELVKGTQPTMRERLYSLPIPRAYVFAEQSLPDPDFADLAGHGIETLVIPKSGHDMVLDNPDGLAEAIKTHILMT